MFSFFPHFLIVAEHSLNYNHVTNFADPLSGFNKISLFSGLCVIVYKIIIEEI